MTQLFLTQMNHSPLSAFRAIFDGDPKNHKADCERCPYEYGDVGRTKLGVLSHETQPHFPLL
jgi:hypothetical protein